MGLFKCLNFQSFPLYLSKRKASVHFHEQMPCLKAVFLQPLSCSVTLHINNTILIQSDFTNIASYCYVSLCGRHVFVQGTLA